MRIRKAEPADAEAVRNVGLKTWPAAYERTPDRDLGDELLWMSRDLQVS